MHRLPHLLAVLCLLACASCTSTYRAEGTRGSLAHGGTARIVVSDDDSGDELCRNAVERELRSRGFRMVSGGPATVQVTMSDTWHWDLVMYLLELDLVFADPGTGSLKAQAHYRNSAFHGFPSQSGVVEKLFRQLDAKGVFAK